MCCAVANVNSINILLLPCKTILEKQLKGIESDKSCGNNTEAQTRKRTRGKKRKKIKIKLQSRGSQDQSKAAERESDTKSAKSQSVTHAMCLSTIKLSRTLPSKNIVLREL